MIHPRKNLAALRAAMTVLAAEGLPQRLVVVGGPAADREDGRDLNAPPRPSCPARPAG